MVTWFQNLRLWKKIILATIIGIAILMILGIIFGTEDTTEPRPVIGTPTPSPIVASISPNPSPTPIPTPIPTSIPISISSSKLYQTHEANEILFEEDFKGEWALITGTVTALEVAGDKYDIKLVGDGFGIIVCKVDKEDARQAELAKSISVGAKTTVLGIIGDMGFTDIEILDCTIETAN